MPRGTNIHYFSIPGLKDKKPLRNTVPQRIIRAILDYRGQTLLEVKAKSRKRTVVYTRQLISYFLATYSELTQSDIGRYFEQDHTTIIYGYTTIKNLLEVEPAVQNDYNIIYNKIFESE